MISMYIYCIVVEVCYILTMTTVYRTAPMDGLEILSCTGEQSFTKHLHDGYVLWLNSDSGERYSLRGTDNILQPGSLSVIEPGIIHANSPYSGNKRHLRSFYFSGQFLQELAANLYEPTTSLTLATEVIHNPCLSQNFIQLHNLLLTGGDSLEIETSILAVFAKLFSHKSTDKKKIALVASDSRLDTVIDYLHDNFNRQITLAELAVLANCTQYHLIRIFQKDRGITPHAYLVQLRLENAKKLLASGCSIADAALESGFSDQSHLSRLFKARFIIPPGVYLKQRLNR